jgi:hypothetical protein
MHCANHTFHRKCSEQPFDLTPVAELRCVSSVAAFQSAFRCFGRSSAAMGIEQSDGCYASAMIDDRGGGDDIGKHATILARKR